MIIRSAFWLTIGFLVVAPHGTDFGAAASQVKDQALAAGTEAATQIIVSQVFRDPVAQIITAKFSSPPSVASPMQDSTTTAFVFPRKRPAAMG
ncbi:MAG: hypothetical protein ABI398_10095 [Devosia sp.]